MAVETYDEMCVVDTCVERYSQHMNLELFNEWIESGCKINTLIERRGLDFKLLYTIPSAIDNLQNIHTIWLKANYLTVIPDEIGNLQLMNDWKN
jgi:hypothetical protein